MSWKRVCATDEIADKSLGKFQVGDVTIVVARLGDKYYAIPPLCPHMEEPLEFSGVLEGDSLTCTKHLWQWDLSAGGKEQGMAERPLLFYDVKTEGSNLMVFVDKPLEYEYEDDPEDDDDDWE